MRLLILMIGLALSGCVTTQNFVEKAAITNSRADFPALSTHKMNSQVTVDHSVFDKFLKTYVVASDVYSPAQGASLVKYSKVTPEDHAALDSYVTRLQTVPVTTLGRDEQLAFWINLYNADTIRAVLENYPVKSIRAIKSSPFDFKGPWNDKRLKVEGTVLTLDNIENRIVRPVFDDPRIHYALNCAAIGCPNLRSRAYSGKDINAALDAQARAFINNSRGVKVVDGKVTASRIFLWYKKDYGQSEGDVLDHIRIYARPELLQSLKGLTSIDAFEYDWDLNEG